MQIKPRYLVDIMNKDVVHVTGINSENLGHSTLKGFTINGKEIVTHSGNRTWTY